MFTRFILLILFTTSITTLSFGQNWKAYPHHQQGSALTFPDDEGYHPGEIVEWWYSNAHVTGDSTGTDYSFMFTYFYYPALSYDGFRIFNLANENTGEFYPETLPCTYSNIAQDKMHIESNTGFSGNTHESWVTMEDSSGNLMPFQYHLIGASANGAVDVYFNALKRPLMVGGTGFLYEGATAYTYYYSLTKLEVTGTITFKNVTETISGTAWMDRQWGSFNPSALEQYEWFSIQLSNGMDMNVWNVYDDNNLIPDTSTYRFTSIYINDSTDRTTSDFELKRLTYAWTPDNQKCYSQKWHLTMDSVDLTITTLHSDNEVSLPFRFYEGSTTIEGTVNGQPVTGTGFAELLHSYQNPDIKITEGNSGWDGVQPFAWQLLNPEGGKDVYYDVELSTDNKQTFSKLAQGLTDTAYQWSPNLPNGTVCWLRIVGYSIDSTLVGAKVSDQSFTIGVTGVNEAAVNTLAIHVSPNPFQQQTTINYQLDEPAQVHAGIYNVEGERLTDLFHGYQNPGQHQLVWEAGNFPSGVYIYQLQTENAKVSDKIILLK